MNKNVLLMALVMSTFVFGLQIAEPAAAASLKVIDHGSYNFKEKNNNVTYKWKTYQKGVNYVKIVEYYYFPQYKTNKYWYTYLQKVSATKIKVKEKIFDYYSDDSSTETTKLYHIPTKLTVAKYYWKKIRPIMTKPH